MKAGLLCRMCSFMMEPMRFFVSGYTLLALTLSSAALAAGPLPHGSSASGGRATGEAQAARREPVTLDELFARLSRARTAPVATRIAAEIQARWLLSGSDTTDLLMQRAIVAMEAKDLPLALDLLDAIIQLKPDYAEAWNQRAIVHFARKELDAALQDVDVTLRLEPRHYGALVGLATMLSEYGYKDRALAAYRRALNIHPFLDGVAKRIDDLAVEVEGRKT
jgi:tetratricopeptide (TPR) repeat protein